MVQYHYELISWRVLPGSRRKLQGAYILDHQGATGLYTKDMILQCMLYVPATILELRCKSRIG